MNPRCNHLTATAPMQSLQRSLAISLYVLAWVSLFVFIGSQLLGRTLWQLELFAHFVPYYAVVLICAGLIYPKFEPNIDHPSKTNKLKWRRQTSIRSLFIVMGMGFAFSAFSPPLQMLKSWYKMPMSGNSNEATKKRPFIVYQNVNIANTQKAQTLTQLTDYNSEILVLVEAGGEWLPHMNALKKKYPVHCGDDQNTPFAMQVFSKVSSAKCELITIDDGFADLPLIKLTLSSKQVLYVIHPPPPINLALAKKRISYLTALRVRLLQEDPKTDVMVIGDMNASAFSPIYRDFVKDTGLRRTTTAGLSTWQPLRFAGVRFGLGIDHFLTTMDWHIDVEPLAWNTSDHRGFMVW